VVVTPHRDTAGAPLAWQVHMECPAHGSGPHATNWTAPGRAEQMTEAVLDRLERHGIDLRGASTVIRARTPADLERTLAAPGGRVHGPPWDGPAALRRRPANRSSLRGLYVAGAGTRPGPGLPMVGISAALVADLIGRA
jgi:phytoene dehydrogenase-like protein